LICCPDAFIEPDSSNFFRDCSIVHVQEFSTSWDIRATPTFFFLKNGQQIDKLVGANKPELERKVVAAAGAASSS
jgi:thioredoxin 1